MIKDKNIRNIAIIAHVDHGKTSLVDRLLRPEEGIGQAKGKTERIMDSGDLEKERGITILSKNASVLYNGIKINIVDTPGHADFGGEVERIMMMVDGVLLLVDAFEGCMPQTRFVLQKALSLGKKPLVVINKIDRPNARPDEVVDEVLDLFIDLNANDDQLDFPLIYTSAKEGYAIKNLSDQKTDITPLLDAIIDHIPPPSVQRDKPLQLLISSLDYDDYIGRIGIGRLESGEIYRNQHISICKTDGKTQEAKVSSLYTFSGTGRVEVEKAMAGDIVALAGIEGLNIGETICDPDFVKALPFIEIDAPTISMNFIVNDSPFAGQEGKYVTSRNIRSRLMKEIETNVSMQVEETGSTDTFKVSGRGELHLSILIETMRREGYEFAVSRPEVILKDEDGVKTEPIELLIIEVPENYVGNVIEKLGTRKGELVNMSVTDSGTSHLEFKIPARGLIGYRPEFLTDTNGYGIMNNIFLDYEPYKGDIKGRVRGSIVAHETGESTAYGLYAAQDRGRLFIPASTPVYEGMIVGEASKAEDVSFNVCRKKQLTNIRAAGSDEALRLVPPTTLSLEQSMSFLKDDELLEVTPLSLRLRKKILNNSARIKSESRKKK